jgi:hypothetical protein
MLRLEAVTEAGVRVDEAPARQRVAELGTQLVDVDVDRAVVGSQRSAPDGLVELITIDNPSFAADEGGEQLKLAKRESESPTCGYGPMLLGPDLQLSCPEDLAIARGAHAAQVDGRSGDSRYRAVKGS